MSALVIILPVVRRSHIDDPSWLEQRGREAWARTFDEMSPPLPTRPMLVKFPDIDRSTAHQSFMDRAIARVAAEERQEGDR